MNNKKILSPEEQAYEEASAELYKANQELNKAKQRYDKARARQRKAVERHNECWHGVYNEDGTKK